MQILPSPRRCFVAFLVMVGTPALAGWFGGGSSSGSSVKLEDAAYVQITGPSNRLGMAGAEQIATLTVSADRGILHIQVLRRRVSGFLDQYQHGLLTPQPDGQRYELAYDRQTGLLSYQAISRVIDPFAVTKTADGPKLDNTDSVTLLQPKDPDIPVFLDSLIDQAELLSQANAQPADCSMAERLKVLPVDALAAALPPEQILYSRDLKPAEGCARAWQRIQQAADSIIELIAPLNPQASAIGSTAAFFDGSPVGRIEPGLSAKLAVIAKTGAYQPIDYDLAAGVPTFELDPRDQSLRVKQKQQPIFTDQQHGGSVLGVAYQPKPTLWDSEASLRALRGQKFKTYARYDVDSRP
jgi:hypothetical protein